MFEEDLTAIDHLVKILKNLDQRVSIRVTTLESQCETLKNKIAVLEADYAALTRRNAETKTEHARLLQGDVHKLLMDQQALDRREQKIFERERTLNQLKAAMEDELQSVRKARLEMDSERRLNNGLELSQHKK